MSQDVSSAIRIIYGVLFLLPARVQDIGLCSGSQPPLCSDGAMNHELEDAILPYSLRVSIVYVERVVLWQEFW